MAVDNPLCSRRKFLTVLAAAVAMWLGGASRSSADPDKFWVFVGTFNDGTSKGIYRMKFDAGSGKLSELSLAAELDNPSFLAIHPTQKYLFAVTEDSERDKSGAVASFMLNPNSGELTAINRQSTGGNAPCHLVVDATGKNVLVANYSGSVAVLPIGPAGELGPASDFIQHTGKVFDPKRQGKPHPHSINLDQGNRFAMVADLGLDRVFVYRFDPIRGKLTPNEPPAVKVGDRSGPRHLAFHPDGKHAFVINEINCTVTAFDFDSNRGTLTEIQTVPTMPIAVEARHSTAEVVVHPSGKFLYASNRGHDSLAVSTIDPGTGRLTLVEHEPTRGMAPRNFAVDPTGSFVLAENMSGTIVVFRVDSETGALDATGQIVEVPQPACAKFVPIPE